jgi:hypothetical protein
VELDFELAAAIPSFDVSVLVTNARGVRVLDESWSDAQALGRGTPGRATARVRIPGVLNVGDHTIGAWLGTSYETLVDAPRLVTLTVDGADLDRPDRAVCLDVPWSVSRDVDDGG